MDDTDEPQRTRQTISRPVLEPMSVAELNDYIAQLQAEITRAEAAIAAKEMHRSAADAFFRQAATRNN